MTYKLEQASILDREKILQDAESYSDIKFRLVGQRYLEKERFMWAANNARDAYLFWAPASIVRAGIYPFYYLFFYRGSWYEIHTQYMGGSELVFDEETPSPRGAELSELKNEIIAAFAAFGRFGDGGVNDSGQLLMPLNATFKEM